MATTSRRERGALADALAQIGPDAPTLCGEWTTGQLAAHIVLRDRRADAAPGIIVPIFSGYTDRVQRQLEQQPFDTLVDQVRSGPPWWAVGNVIPNVVNTGEFFVHHEDIRRAQPAWEPRELDEDIVDTLYRDLKQLAPRLASSSPVGIILQPDGDRDAIQARKGSPEVIVSGPVGELMMWTFGRKPEAMVELSGDADAVGAAIDATFSL